MTCAWRASASKTWISLLVQVRAFKKKRIESHSRLSVCEQNHIYDVNKGLNANHAEQSPHT